MNKLYNQNENTTYVDNVIKIQQLQLRYQNVVTHVFEIVRNNYTIKMEAFINLVIYIFTVLIFFEMYVALHYILIHY